VRNGKEKNQGPLVRSDRGSLCREREPTFSKRKTGEFPTGKGLGRKELDRREKTKRETCRARSAGIKQPRQSKTEGWVTPRKQGGGRGSKNTRRKRGQPSRQSTKKNSQKLLHCLTRRLKYILSGGRERGHLGGRRGPRSLYERVRVICEKQKKKW